MHYFRNFFAFMGTHVLGPFTLLPVILAMVSFSLSPQPWTAFTVALIFTTVIPFFIAAILLRTGLSSNFYIVKRHQRRTFYAFSVASVGTGLAILVGVPGGQSVAGCVGIMLLSLCIAALINRYLKISLHALVATTACLVSLFLYGWMLTYVTVPVWLLVCWARVSTRQHSIREVLAGSALGVLASVGYAALLNLFA